MGRGRARAKQAKIARELKYNTPVSDFKALQRELCGNGSSDSTTSVATDSDELDYDSEHESEQAGEQHRLDR